MDKNELDQLKRELPNMTTVEVNPDSITPIPKLVRRCKFASVHFYFLKIDMQLPVPPRIHLLFLDFGVRRWDYYRAVSNDSLMRKVIPGIRRAYLRELLALAEMRPEMIKPDQEIAACGSITDPLVPDFEVPMLLRDDHGLHLGLADGGARHAGYQAMLYAVPLG